MLVGASGNYVFDALADRVPWSWRQFLDKVGPVVGQHIVGLGLQRLTLLVPPLDLPA